MQATHTPVIAIDSDAPVPAYNAPCVTSVTLVGTPLIGTSPGGGSDLYSGYSS